MSWGKWNDDQIKINIKRNMKHYRVERGLTKSAIAKLLSVKPIEVSRWESLDEARLPDIDALHIFCEHLGVNIVDVFGIEPSVPAVDSEYVELISCFKELSMNGREELKKYARYLVAGERESIVKSRQGKRGAS